jgi:hypothetical protein
MTGSVYSPTAPDDAGSTEPPALSLIIAYIQSIVQPIFDCSTLDICANPTALETEALRAGVIVDLNSQ